VPSLAIRAGQALGAICSPSAAGQARTTSVSPSAGPRREETAERAVEVRAACGRAAFHHHEPVGREDERRDLCAQLLGRAERGAVHARLLCISRAQGHLDLEPPGAQSACQLDPGGLGPEADELRVVAAPRREALRADVQRLEQVRLARPVLTDGEHEPGLEAQLERGVGAVVAERERLNDQP
jgi:hypothetical protein